MAQHKEVQPNARTHAHTRTRMHAASDSNQFFTNVIVQIAPPASADRLRRLSDMPAVGIKIVTCQLITLPSSSD